MRLKMFLCIVKKSTNASRQNLPRTKTHNDLIVPPIQTGLLHIRQVGHGVLGRRFLCPFVYSLQSSQASAALNMWLFAAYDHLSAT